VTIDFAFASVVTIQDIKKGERFTEDNIWVKRPGINGIPASYYDEIIGKVSKCDISEDSMINTHCIDGFSI
jgi:N-acetylneuraminate synthase